jgi:hypothetical protein
VGIISLSSTDQYSPSAIIILMPFDLDYSTRKFVRSLFPAGDIERLRMAQSELQWCFRAVDFQSMVLPLLINRGSLELLTRF